MTEKEYYMAALHSKITHTGTHFKNTFIPKNSSYLALNYYYFFNTFYPEHWLLFELFFALLQYCIILHSFITSPHLMPPTCHLNLSYGTQLWPLYTQTRKQKGVCSCTRTCTHPHTHGWPLLPPWTRISGVSAAGLDISCVRTERAVFPAGK